MDWVHNIYSLFDIVYFIHVMASDTNYAMIGLAIVLHQIKKNLNFGPMHHWKLHVICRKDIINIG